MAVTSWRPGISWIVLLSFLGKNLNMKWKFHLFCFRAFEYIMDVEKLNLSAIRTVRVLRPLKAINRIPSMR